MKFFKRCTVESSTLSPITSPEPGKPYSRYAQPGPLQKYNTFEQVNCRRLWGKVRFCRQPLKRG